MKALSRQNILAPVLVAASFLLTPVIVVAGDGWGDQGTARHAQHSGKVVVIKKPQQHHASVNHAKYVKATPRRRDYRGISVARRYGTPYPGFGFLYTDAGAHKWLAFTAITLKVLDNLNEEQQRMHEQAQIEATTAEVGDKIVWEDENASGTVTTTRVGTSTSGRQCREFQQTVVIGGKSEQAYGTACLHADGNWEIVSSAR